MIKIENVTKIYGSGANRVAALDDVTVTIRENEFFTLLGPSGCGKTTLLRVLAGFVDPTQGRVTMEGDDLLHLPPHRRPVNTVFQNYALFPHLTVSQNVSFGLEMLGKPKTEIRKTVAEMLALVKMEKMADRLTSQISGGQQQRVALARALAPRPKVLLLDESLSALDFKLRKEMQLELKRLQSETGITFVFVTHDQEEALTMSDRIAVMNSGAIRQIGTPRDIYDHPAERFVADFIGDTNLIEGDVIESGQDRVVVSTHGAQLAARSHEGVAPQGRVTLAIRPEHARIGPEGSGGLAGTLRTVVYVGTDSHYHVDLGGPDPFVVRRQNTPDEAAQFTEGQQVSVTVPDGVAQVLRD